MSLAFATLACAAELDAPKSEAGGAAATEAQSASVGDMPARARYLADRETSRRLLQSIGSEVDTLLLAVAVANERASELPADDVARRYETLSRLADSALSALEEASAGDASSLSSEKVESLSRIAGQMPVQVKRIKLALRASGLTAAEYAEVARGLEAVRLSARSLGASLAEARETLQLVPSGRLSAAEHASIETLSGPIGGSWYLIDEGHVDVIDVAYEDEELGLSIHDESVVPDVERDPATTILFVKSSAKAQVPDERFAFLGPVGSDFWLLPEGQPEAEAAGLIWAGIATHEVDSGVFVDDSLQVRFLNVLGPNGLSLFQSPQDELTDPTIVVDSEDGLPDTLAVPAQAHLHYNWAFEAPGVYFVKIRARGQLADVPGNPWVRSEDAVLKFVVQP